MSHTIPLVATEEFVPQQRKLGNYYIATNTSAMSTIC